MAEPLLAVDLDLRVPGFRARPRFRAGAERVVIFGPSGAGKSMTLRAMAGLLRPTAGTLRLGERVLDDPAHGLHLAPQQRRIGYVPQNYALFPHLSLRDNVAYGLHAIPRAQRAARVEALLERMRLADLANRLPRQLSGGQQQRAALARALAPSPEMLLMDEPLGAVEETLRAELREEIRALQIHDRIPVVLITHSLSEAYSLADRLVVIVGGDVRQSGRREQVFRHPATPEVARLLGMSNILEATVEGADGDALRVRWRGHALRVPLGGSAGSGNRVTLGIRPESLMILREAPSADEARENVLQGRVAADRPQGYDHLLTFAVEGAESAWLEIRIPHPVVMRLGLEVGARRYAAIQPEAIHRFDPASAAGPDALPVDG